MNIEDRVRKTLARMDVEADTIRPDTVLKDDLEIDSAERVELVVNLEEEFEVSLGPEAEKVATFGGLCSLIQNELNRTHGESDAATSE